MDIGVIERLLETFFRRPLLYVVPLVLCLAFGVYSGLSQPKIYISTGVLSASRDSLLSNLSNIGDNGGFGFETSASVTSDRINEQLRSDDFVRTVATTAGLGTALEAGAVGLPYVRSSVWASPDGENLLKVNAGTGDPVLSARLANATIESFIQSVVDEDLSQSTAAQSFYENIADTYKTEADAARTALDDFLKANPAPATAERPAAQQTQLDQLTSAYNRAQAQYTNALSKVEDASLASEQARIDVTQRIKVVDAPTEPPAPISGLRDLVMTVGTFGVLGVMLTLGLVGVASFLDKTVRTTRDVKSRLGFDLVTSVPKMRFAARAVRRA